MKKYLLILIFLGCVFAPRARAAVVFNTSSTMAFTGKTTATTSIIVGSGSNQMLVITLAMGNALGTGMSASVAGNAATLLAVATGTSRSVNIWDYPHLSPGTYVVSTTWTTATQGTLFRRILLGRESDLSSRCHGDGRRHCNEQSFVHAYDNPKRRCYHRWHSPRWRFDDKFGRRNPSIFGERFRRCDLYGRRELLDSALGWASDLKLRLERHRRMDNVADRPQASNLIESHHVQRYLHLIIHASRDERLLEPHDGKLLE